MTTSGKQEKKSKFEISDAFFNAEERENGILTCTETRKPTAQAGRQVRVPVEEIVGLGGGVDTRGDNHGYNKPVNAQDTRHDDRNDTLHDKLRAHHAHGCYANAALRRSVRRSGVRVVRESKERKF